jgi:formylglycine-generating enzyme required for sulfatase activity
VIGGHPACRLAVSLWWLVSVAAVGRSETLADLNETLLRELQATHGLTEEQMAKIRAIFNQSRFIGQGNPTITEHPMSPAECRARLAEQHVEYSDPRFERICGGPFMAPLYDPKTQRPEQAGSCIDQFEFPDIPCTYPVVWVRAREAALLCRAMGKRLCDAHEWEGACAGSLEPPDYRFDLAAGVDPSNGVRRMRTAHNQIHDQQKLWSYGPAYRTGICAASSHKSPRCEGGGWSTCGSNTYPAGSFPECRSTLGVCDLHGNAAEHMNLPLDSSQMASRGSLELGYTEMKGSWFIFDSYKAHEDACRWRAPYWHGGRVMDPDSHHNYHLGFRCCRTIAPKTGKISQACPPPPVDP